MDALTVTEVQRLEVLESVIDAGMQTFVHVGNALLEIRDSRLYRTTHGTFEDYCRERWQMSKTHANRMIESAAVVHNLTPIGVIDQQPMHLNNPATYPANFPLPVTESQVRPLTTLQPDEQREVWRRAVETAPNGKVTAAHVQTTVTTYKETTTVKTTVEPKRPQHFTLTVDQWQHADSAQHSEWLFSKHQSDATFNQTNDNIEWAAWSWNPVTGCLHGCEYCYARDIANRFYFHLPDGERFAPVFYPDRLCAPSKTKQPDLAQIDDPIDRMARRNVFVCSMADLFGKWVPSAWIDAILKEAWDNPQWTFLFLTKFPIRMAEFDFPLNSWIGTTVDKQWSVDRAEKAFSKIRSKGYQGVAWLSCEPMMERLQFGSLEMFDWVVVGGSSRSTQTPEFRPPFEWIVNLWNQAKVIDVPVYMKTNLGIEQRVREYPTKLPA